MNIERKKTQNSTRPAKYAGKYNVAHQSQPTRRIYKQSTTAQSSGKTNAVSNNRSTNETTHRLALAAIAHSGNDASNRSYESPIVLLAESAKNGIFRKLLYGFAGLVLVVSMAASLQSLFINRQAGEQIATLGASTSRGTDDQGVSQGTGNEPSEEAVPANAIHNYTVANPEHPRVLRIPALSVEARIKPLGVDTSGAIDAPWNIHDAGWFEDSARPGNPNGSSLLLGHVSGWSGPGVFKKINKLEIGMRFSVEKGSGELITYEVNGSEQIGVDVLNMAHVLSAEVPGEHDLKLMTCSGKYNSSTESYDDRYIVYATRVN